ncbi:MAG TPA: hypothetical protein VNX21_01850 [Candidatus Thermoplasmatota archaeon]|nr:hypothetical protein [Candidatus Thermoplasmatota archaeon]
MLAIAVLAAVPAAQGAYLVRPAPDTYLDFLTHLVHDATGKVVGAGAEPMYANLDIWTKNEPMMTSALDVTVTPHASAREPWPPRVDVDPADPSRLVSGSVQAGVAVEGVGSNGVCLHDYCISAEAFIWSSDAPPVMEITWLECAPVCADGWSGPIHGKLMGNHLVWTGGFDPPAHKGAVTKLCMFINGIAVSGRCDLGDVFGYGTFIPVGCIVYYGKPTCAQEVYIDE